METGVLFDIDALNELGAVTYGTAAWSVLMHALEPVSFCSCAFLHGDVDVQAIKRPYSFCISIDPLLDEKADRFVEAFSQCIDESLLPLERRFARGDFYRLLVPAGRIDGRGRFVVAGNQQWLFRSAAAASWRFLPGDDWLGSFASEFLLHVEPCNVLPWDDEFAELARQALCEAGPATLVALNRYLGTVLKDAEVAATCRDRIGVLEALYAQVPWPSVLSRVLEQRIDGGSRSAHIAEIGNCELRAIKFGDEVLVEIIEGQRSGAIVLLKLSWLVDLAQELGCPADDIGYAVMCASLVASFAKRGMSELQDVVRCASLIASLAKRRAMPDGPDAEWRSFNFETVDDGHSVFEGLGPSWKVPCLTVLLWST